MSQRYLLVLDKLEPSILKSYEEKFRELNIEIIVHLKGTENLENWLGDKKNEICGIIVRSTLLSTMFLENFPQLKVIGRSGVGIDNIPLEYCLENDIKVENTPGVCSNSVAELTIAMMLNLSRHLISDHTSIQNGAWNRKMGNELRGRTLGIVGCGNIGSRVAMLASAFGMEVLAYDIVKREEMKHMVKYVSFNELLKRSHIITLHVPLYLDTFHMIGKETIPKMTQRPIIINTARGLVIDKFSVYQGLLDNSISGMAMDVYDEEPIDLGEPLYTHENVMTTSHIGSQTYGVLEGNTNEILKKVYECLT